MKKNILILISLCSSGIIFSQKAHKVNYTHFKQYKEDKEQSIYVADYDASRRGSIIIHDHSNTKNPVRILSEPPPDAILAFTTTITNSLNINEKLTTNQSANFSQAIKELTKRNTTIVVLRDALYRLNEYDFNNPGVLRDSIYLKKFDKILDLVARINEKEKIEAIGENAKEVEKLTIRENYQNAIRLLLDKDEKNALNNFSKMYSEYPTHFNIKEINEKLIELKKDGILDEEWKKLYLFIIDGKTWQIDEELIEQLKEKSKKS